MIEESNYERLWLQSLDKYLAAHLHHYDLKVGDLAKALSMSERSFRDHLVSYTGLKPKQYLQKTRVQAARRCLLAGFDGSIQQLANAVGFRKEATFRTAYEAQYGKLTELDP